VRDKKNSINNQQKKRRGEVEEKAKQLALSRQKNHALLISFFLSFFRDGQGGVFFLLQQLDNFLGCTATNVERRCSRSSPHPASQHITSVE